MDELSALRLQIEWGADEALLDAPCDRFADVPVAVAQRAPAPAVVRVAAVVHAVGQAAAPSSGPALAAQAVQAAAAAADLAGLQAVLDAFDGCPLRGTASTTVAPSGNPAAGLILVGEAPGPDDDRSGQAFSGPPGERMDRVLASAGFSRDDLLYALMVPWRPPGGRPVSEAELALCLPFFHRLLALARPRRVVLMGAGPYRALGGEEGGFRKARGKVREMRLPGLGAAVPVLTILAPDMWLSSATNRQATWSDILTLRAMAAAAPTLVPDTDPVGWAAHE